MWLSFGVEDWEFNFKECSLRVSSDDGWLDIAVTVVVFVKASVRGGDVFLVGVILRVSFRVFIFGCSAYIWRL